MPDYKTADYDFIEGNDGKVVGLWVKTENLTQKGMVCALLAKHKMDDLLGQGISGDFTVKPNTLDNNGGYFIVFTDQSSKGRSLNMEVNYGGVKYIVFYNVQDFTDEVRNSTQAILKTSYGEIKNQVIEIMKNLEEYYRTPSELISRLLGSKTFCANDKCGAAFSKRMLELLLLPTYEIANFTVPEKCPKCGAVELYFLCKL